MPSLSNGKILTSTAIISIAVIFLLAFFPATTLRISSASPSQSNFAGSYAQQHTFIVKPNGYNDTTDIQRALNKCATDSPQCTVQLVKGTYYIDQITVYGFQGNFVGSGQGVTIIQALPNLPSPASQYNTNTIPFWAGLPGPANPWPDLFTFVNGTFVISGMTINEPYTNSVYPGWYELSTTLYTSLYSAIEITGEQAFATIDHVTVLGTSGDAAGTNMWNGVEYEGVFLPPGWTNANAQVIPLSGSFTVTNSVFNSVQSGAFADFLTSSTVTICYNTMIINPVPLGFFDVSNSKLLYCENQATGVQLYTAFEGLQSVYKSGLLASTVYITGNYFQVSEGANAVYLQDFGVENFGTPSTLSAVVSGNVFYTNTSCECYVGNEPNVYSVVLSLSLKSVTISQNTILGGGSAGIYMVGGPGIISSNTILGSYAGVWVDYANYTMVLGNVIKNSAEYGIAVTDGSSYNLIGWNYVMKSGVYDLYWDGTGSGNVWIGNHYQTSSPPNLG